MFVVFAKDEIALVIRTEPRCEIRTDLQVADSILIAEIPQILLVLRRKVSDKEGHVLMSSACCVPRHAQQLLLKLTDIPARASGGLYLVTRAQSFFETRKSAFEKVRQIKRAQ